MDHIDTALKHILDVVSFAAVIGSLAQILPPIAALMSMIWIGMQMYAWVIDRKEKRKLNKDDPE